MGSEVRLSRRARSDLEDIFLYTAREWSPAQARVYVSVLHEAMTLIATKTHRAQSLDHVREGYRAYRVRSHLLIYRENADVTEIVRILHARMDVPRHL